MIYSTYYITCNADRRDMKECTGDIHRWLCDSDYLQAKTPIQKWQQGCCSNHVAKLSADKQKRAQEHAANNKDRWKNSEKRVWNYHVEEKPE
jgi:hypothetical protein